MYNMRIVIPILHETWDQISKQAERLVIVVAQSKVTVVIIGLLCGKMIT